MGTKNNPGLFDCYASAQPDEPIFVLLARDPDAAILVRMWSHMRLRRALVLSPLSEGQEARLQKIKEADDCADAMDDWRHENT